MLNISRSLFRAGGTALLAALLLTGPGQAADKAEAFLQQARGYFEKGELKAAVIELKNALQQDPSLVPARHLLGQAYLRVGNGPGAEKELERARALGLNSPQLVLDLAEAKLLQRRAGEVLELLEPVPEGAAPLRVRGLTLRGLAEAASGRRQEARASLEAALELQPDNPRASLALAQLDLLDADAGAAGARVEAVLGQHPGHLQALLLQAEIQRKAGRLEAAVSTYDTALKHQPGALAAHLGRATAALALGRLELARADLEAVDQVQKGLPTTHYLRGLLAYLERSLDVARGELQQVLGVAPEHAPSQLLFGLVSYDRQEYETAEEFLGRFLTAQPGNLAALKTQAAARLKLKNPKGAVELLQPLVHGESRDVQLLTLLGSAYLMTGEYARGAELLQAAVELQPDAAPLRTQLALGLLAEGQSAAAADQLQAAVDLGQDLIQADVLLVMTHLRARELDKALQASQALEQRLPDNPLAYNLTGLTYLARKEPDQARARFTKALETDPKFVTAEANLARLDLADGDRVAAGRRFRRIVEVEPASLTGLVGLAGIAELDGDRAAMVQYLEQAAAANPRAAQPSVLLARHHLKSREPLKALAAAAEAQRRSPDSPAVLDVLARAQVAAGEASSAARTFERLAGAAPTADNYQRLARARAAAKDFRGAREAARQALTLQPEALAPKLLLGAIELQDGGENEALRLAQAIQQEHPKQVDGYRLEGLVRARLGEWATAAEAFQRAYGIEKSASLARQLAGVQQKLGRPEDAVAVLRDWLGQQADDHGTRMALAMALQAAGKNPEAITEYEALVAAKQEHGVLLNNLAWLYFQQGDARATALAERAYALEPRRGEVADTYGWILLNTGGDRNQALTALQSAYLSLPGNAEIGYHVAVALHRMGRDEEALRTLRTALAEAPRFGDLEQARALLAQLEGRPGGAGQGPAGSP
jgi:putative PEP-CTERM system TPR-repeat lipoprotein